MITGIKFRLASSNGLTLQMAAAGIKAQGISVLKPMKDILLSRHYNDFPIEHLTSFVFIFRINNNLFE